MTELQLAGRTDVGRQRRDNQDAFICQPIWSGEIEQTTDSQIDKLPGNPSALLVVIDGVGGYAGGERAATIAHDAILRYMETPTGDTLTMLREAVVYANNQIDQERRTVPGFSMMCCVLTAAVTDSQANKVYFVHVGDTRLYRFRQQATGETTQNNTSARGGVTLEKLTSDHSVVGIREDANQLTEAEAMQHPRRNEVLRTVGSAPHRIDDTGFLESGEADFGPGDGLLLCSDGLTDMLPRATIEAVLSESSLGPSLDEALDELIRQANEAGGQDNITVVLALSKTAVSQPPTVNIPTPEPMSETIADETPLATTVAPTAAPVSSDKKETGNWWLIGALLAFMAVLTYFFLIR
ncbi:PP2C family protein-serine/threonine phosphatase [Fibrella aquatilis]|uniref:Serine/threonine-protein phosphatase n=1 Tax=Fibrella aquatilis TaxID=2817059 RepID=A0A939G733_9BACT|nr:protein phosphatase 2C domain-containing protein [Fibrella aquatilis]MBO0931844.1 serine/threonine-protein phosphatase [Fibrella aquatilis]